MSRPIRRLINFLFVLSLIFATTHIILVLRSITEVEVIPMVGTTLSQGKADRKVNAKRSSSSDMHPDPHYYSLKITMDEQTHAVYWGDQGQNSISEEPKGVSNIESIIRDISTKR